MKFFSHSERKVSGFHRLLVKPVATAIGGALLVAAVAFTSHPPVHANTPPLTQSSAQSVVKEFLGHLVQFANQNGEFDTESLQRFSVVFQQYSDINIISRAVLGADARQLSPAALDEFTRALQFYLTKKYSEQFKKLAGGAFSVKDARKIRAFYEVPVMIELPNQQNIKTVFLVSDKSGKVLVFDIYIAGISLLRTTRFEIGALLDKQHGDINRLITVLNRG